MNLLTMNFLPGKNTSVKFTEYFKSCGYKRSLYKGLYNFENF